MPDLSLARWQHAEVRSGASRLVVGGRRPGVIRCVRPPSRRIQLKQPLAGPSGCTHRVRHADLNVGTPQGKPLLARPAGREQGDLTGGDVAAHTDSRNDRLASRVGGIDGPCLGAQVIAELKFERETPVITAPSSKRTAAATASLSGQRRSA